MNTQITIWSYRIYAEHFYPTIVFDRNGCFRLIEARSLSLCKHNLLLLVTILMDNILGRLSR